MLSSAATSKIISSFPTSVISFDNGVSYFYQTSLQIHDKFLLQETVWTKQMGRYILKKAFMVVSPRNSILQ